MIDGAPGVAVYKPAGIPARDLQWIEMTVDEYEAVRLIDHEGLEQEAAAELLGVSRPTVSRILAHGRSKLAQMLVTGAALIIEGGPVLLSDHGPGGGHGRHGGQGRSQGRGCGRHRGGRIS